MIVNLKGTILYVTENMTELAGPCIVSVCNIKVYS